jgi:UDP-glucose 4-epimerase
MRHLWVIGAGGLLGSALYHALGVAGEQLFAPREALAWGNETHLLDQLGTAVMDFASHVGPLDTWEIYWAAGVGTLSTPASDLTRETAALAFFLHALEQQASLRNVPGAFGFASSAGAIYAGSPNEVINEETPVAPTTPYAHAKLAQEALVHAFNGRQRGVSSLVARISTLYGVGQATAKKQGLLTHIARSIVRNTPIQIYVPFDTIRDYIAVADAAARMIMALRDNPGHVRHRIQLLASETPTTVAEIIGAFKRVSRRTPRVVTGITRNTALYTHCVQFRSIAPASIEPRPHTNLIVGIGQLLQAERLYFAQSSSK